MGYDIPMQTTMFVNVWAIGRDEKNWSSAKEFKPERLRGLRMARLMISMARTLGSFPEALVGDCALV